MSNKIQSSIGTSSPCTSTSTALPETAVDRSGNRNIFHEYDGPIVLLGTSGTGNELTRLAAFLSTQLASSGESRIIPLLPTTKTDDFIATAANNEYRWPDVILLDQSFLNDGEKKGEPQMQMVAKSLYEESDCLVIYVNTKSDSGTGTGSLNADEKMLWEDTIFVQYSDYEICILDEGGDDDGVAFEEDWEHIEWELLRILARARLEPAIPGATTPSVNTAHLTMGQNTFFLSLSFADIALVEPFVAQMCLDVDAMEYRTDLLTARDNRFDLIYGMQLLRRYSRPHTVRVPALPLGGLMLEDVMPIVYTVRTRNQAGTYPDDESGINKMFELLEWGLRGGVEVLDVESAWDPEKTRKLLDKAERRYTSQILGSHHVVGKEITTEEAVELFLQCALQGRAHGAKVVLSINDQNNDRMAYEAALIATELASSAGDPVIPHISLILGEVGQFSRVINLCFTPVTHESLPFAAAPGQLTANEIMTTRLLTKIFTPMKYAILGHNIAYSVSPQMHGAAFAATKLPSEYIRVDVATVEEFIESDLFKSDDFGGTSVTVPHKQAIMKYVDVFSEAALAIGSVNTLIAKQVYDVDEFKREIYGDNTDWKGIFNPLNRLLGGIVDPPTGFALIVGAGGTARAAAYVATKLGLKPIYYNRTPSKAEELAVLFGGTVVTSLEEVGEEKCLGTVLVGESPTSLKVVISTLPAASDFVLPDWLYSSERAKPIVFDVNYKPFSTMLLLQAEVAGCRVVRGSEMLWEQGVGQFELWTGRTAPYRVMKQVVLQNCVEDQTLSFSDPAPTSVFE